MYTCIRLRKRMRTTRLKGRRAIWKSTGVYVKIIFMYLSRRSVPMGVGVASTGRSAAATDAAFWCWRGVVTEARRHFHRIITIGSHERLIATRWQRDEGSLNSPHKTPRLQRFNRSCKRWKKKSPHHLLQCSTCKQNSPRHFLLQQIHKEPQLLTIGICPGEFRRWCS